MNGKFDKNISDVKIQSSEGVVFDLHKTLLEACTGAFPGPEMNTDDQIIELSETADVLRLLFAFVYPKRHPDLEDKDFELVAALAEAVGKYDVFPAVNTCNARLRSFLPEHNVEIFTYALKHGHPRLADEACPYLVRTRLIPVLKKLPTHYFLPWVEYHDKWSSIFSEARTTIKSLPSVSHVALCHSQNAVCNTCRSSLFTWVAQIEELDSVQNLRNALSDPSLWSANLSCCNAPLNVGQFGGTSQPPPICDHIVVLAKACVKRVEDIPAFSKFVS